MALTAQKSTFTDRLMAGAAALAVMIVAAPLSANVQAGKDAWSAGDYARAVSEWQEPAANGDPEAQFNLGRAYRLGQGVEENLQRARELYRAAARAGHVEAADHYGLLLVQLGEPDLAMPYVIAASDRGDPRAQYVLGLAHFNADFAERDWVRAYALISLAEDAGLPQAGPALEQLAQYVPLAQRRQAEALAEQMAAELEQRRVADLNSGTSAAGTPRGASLIAVSHTQSSQEEAFQPATAR